MNAKRLKRTRQILPWVVMAGLIGVWQLVCVGLKIPSYLIPSPVEVAHALIKYRDSLAIHSLQTLFTTMTGFALAVGIGMLIGMAVGASVLVYAGLYPVLIAFNSVPKVALIPILVIWFGIGTIPAILSSFVIAFFPIVVNVATGLATIEPEMEDVLRSLGASRLEILTKAGIPRSLPYLFASIKVALTLAFVGSIMSETVASNNGIGFVMVSAAARFETPLVFAALTVVGVLGLVMYSISVWFERRMTGWAFRSQLVT
jgi:NitT/TauT family transport system permease protein